MSGNDFWLYSFHLPGSLVRFSGSKFLGLDGGILNLGLLFPRWTSAEMSKACSSILGPMPHSTPGACCE